MGASQGQLISIVIPCHNEGGNIEPLYEALTEVVAKLNESFEFIFVDDGSRDDTIERIARIGNKDSRVQIVELARNFGKEIAVTAGLHRSKGDAAITIDADLQHPPALIPELVAKWHDGVEVVVGVRQTDANYAPWLKRAGSRLFYRLMRAIAESEVVPNATDYRLIDRVVIDEFNRFTERNRLTRGLIDWLGFSRAYVPFVAAERFAGEAAYSYFKLLRLAINAFVSMSLLPLKLAGYAGMIITLISAPVGLVIFVEKYLTNDSLGWAISGPAILAIILLFLVGVILMSLGLIALYIANIHAEVMNRPLYVARRRRPILNISEHNAEAAEAAIDDDLGKAKIRA